MRGLIGALLVSFLAVAPARAEPPTVLTDIAPVHSLVAQVMEGVGTPTLLLSPGTSPHDVNLRPSQARALSKADLIVFIGLNLTPWLAGPLEMVAADRRLSLLEVDGITHRIARADRGGKHANDHDDGHSHHHDGSHEEGHDPHAWLDPLNARTWVGAIADRLSEADPANAERYHANAMAAASQLGELNERMTELLSEHSAAPYIVYHDGYRHLEDRFGLVGGETLTGSDAAPVGAQSVVRVRKLLAARPGTCLFLEPEVPTGQGEALADGTGARVAWLDPLGAAIEPGPGQYSHLMTGLAETMAGCLSGERE